MRDGMKVLKGIFFFVMGLIMAACAGILICALNPSLTAMLARRVEGAYEAQAAQPAQSDGLGELGGIGGMLSGRTGLVGEGRSADNVQGIPAGNQPGIDAGWLDRVDYEPPDSQPVETPDSVSGRTGYEPVREEAEQIGEEEAEDLTDAASSGETGSGLTFDGEEYPYYAMLEPDMQQIYSQIYANVMEVSPSFTPVVDVSVSQLKTVFEAVYNDHPELFWLDTGYSCKYLRSGRCVEVALKYNRTVDALEEAKSAFEGTAGNIVSQAQGLGSDAEKERYVHDALMQLVEYDLSAPMNQSAYSALVGGRSVCAGYARAFQYMMQLLDIPCYYCTGFAGEDHAWNIVKIDDAYHNVDVTWDDTDTPTYDYFNKSDRSFGTTHVRTGLSVYLPACVDGESPGAAAVAGQGDGENPGTGAVPGQGGDSSGSGDGAAAGTGEPGEDSSDLSNLINPNPVEPLTWQSKVSVEPVEENQEPTAEQLRQENLNKAGITEEQVRDTMQEYYEDCQKLLKEVGTGDQQFINVIPESLWSSIERAYGSGDYWQQYVEPVMKELGIENFVIQLQVEDLGGGYYRLYHNIYTY